MEAIENNLSIQDLTLNDTTMQEPCRRPARYKLYRESADQLLGYIVDQSESNEFLQKKCSSLSFPGSENEKEESIFVRKFNTLAELLIISEKGFIKRYWDIIFELNLAFSIITSLSYLAYGLPGLTMKILDLISWVIFFIDILLKFFTEYSDEHGNSVRNLRLIAKNYLFGSLILDLIAILPLRFFGQDKTEYLIRTVRVLKLTDVIDITDGTGVSYLLTFFNFGRKDKNGNITHSVRFKIISTFVKMFLALVFVVYFLGCAWFYFQTIVNGCKYSSSGKDDEKSFGTAYNLSEFHIEEQALRSTYYMLTTLTGVGYGDFAPKNIYEMAFVSTVVLLGVAFFAVVIGSFNNAINDWEDSNSGTDNIGLLISWLESVEKTHGKMDPALRTQILQFFQYYFHNDRLKNLAKKHWEVENPEDLISVSQKYVSELADDIYFEILEKLFPDFLYFFQGYFTYSNFKYHILAYLEPRKYLQNQFLFNAQDNIDEVIFVLSGFVALGVQIKNEFNSLLYFPEGRTVVGDFSALTKTKSKFDCLAVTNLDTFVVNAEVFYNMLDSFYKKDFQNILGISGGREFHLKRILNEHLQLAGFSHNTLLHVKDRYFKERIVLNVHGKYSEENIEHNLERINKLFKKLEGDTVKIIGNLNRVQNLIPNTLKPVNKKYIYKLAYNPRFYIRK